MKTLKKTIRYILRESWESSFDSIAARLDELIGKDFTMLRHLEKMGFKNGRFLLAHIPKDFLFMGAGMYRVVFAPNADKDLVVKIAKTEDGCLMNRDDALVGKNGYWSKVFPKCYIAADDFRWVVQERCDRASKRELQGYPDLSDFFINSYFYYFADDSEWSVLICAFALGAGQTLEEIKKTCKGAYEAAALEIRRSIDSDVDVVIKAIHDELMQTSPTFKLWCAAIKRFEIAPNDLYSNNLGFSIEDGRPIILDSSFIKSMEGRANE